MNDELRMAELLCTRLCHDLTGPIGAVNNGAEFLSEDGFNLQNQAVELIVSSAFSAVARLQFYRSAYGNVKEGGEANLADKQKIATDFFVGSKITLDWPDTHTEAAGISLSTKTARLIFNLLVIASGALIRGGAIAVRLGLNDAGGKSVIVSAKGQSLKWDPELDKILGGKFNSEDLDPKNVQAQLTRHFIDDLGATFTQSLNGDELTLEVTQPAVTN